MYIYVQTSHLLYLTRVRGLDSKEAALELGRGHSQCLQKLEDLSLHPTTTITTITNSSNDGTRKRAWRAWQPWQDKQLLELVEERGRKWSDLSRIMQKSSRQVC
jgi:hypothetical protein